MSQSLAQSRSQTAAARRRRAHGWARRPRRGCIPDARWRDRAAGLGPAPRRSVRAGVRRDVLPEAGQELRAGLRDRQLRPAALERGLWILRAPGIMRRRRRPERLRVPGRERRGVLRDPRTELWGHLRNGSLPPIAHERGLRDVRSARVLRRWRCLERLRMYQRERPGLLRRPRSRLRIGVGDGPLRAAARACELRSVRAAPDVRGLWCRERLRMRRGRPPRVLGWGRLLVRLSRSALERVSGLYDHGGLHGDRRHRGVRDVRRERATLLRDRDGVRFGSRVQRRSVPTTGGWWHDPPGRGAPHRRGRRGRRRP